jgi:hypothetical protein
MADVLEYCFSFVMPGFVPGLPRLPLPQDVMAGSKPGHDDRGIAASLPYAAMIS